MVKTEQRFMRSKACPHAEPLFGCHHLYGSLYMALVRMQRKEVEVAGACSEKRTRQWGKQNI